MILYMDVATTRSIRRNGKLYTLREDIANSITHGIGGVLAIIGTVIILIISIRQNDALKIVSSAIYGFSAILLFTMSTLYHSFTNDTVKKVFRVFDHTSISILIAGTYTPYTLVLLRGKAIGLIVFSVVWGVNILSIVLKSISVNRFEKISLACYIISGWCALIAIVPIIKALALPGLILLFLGGLMYTSGIFFYAKVKTHYMHAVWHLFVLAGAILHYFSIILYVI